MKLLLRQICILVTILSLASGAAWAGSFNVELSGEKQQIQGYEHKDIQYYSFSEFVDLVGGQLEWDILGHQVSYVIDTTRFVFLIGSPFFKINETVHNLTYPVELKEGQLYLPALTSASYLDQVFPHKITYTQGSNTLRVSSEYFNVTDISFSRKANGLLVEIFVTSALPYDVTL